MKRDPRTDAPNFWNYARDYLHAYMPKVRGLSGKTVEAYRISLENYVDFLDSQQHIERPKVTFEHFERRHLKTWITWMKSEKTYKPRTIKLRLSAIKAFLAYAACEDIALVALSEAAKTLTVPSEPKSPIEYLTEPETRALLAAFSGQTPKSRRNRMLLILLYDTAARVGEIASLTLQDLHMTKPGRVVLTGKRSKTRIVPLTEKAIEHLNIYLDEFHPHKARQITSRPLFYSRHQGQPTSLSTDTISAVLKQAAHMARMSCPSIPDKIHCHMLRKTKAMDLYQQGIPLPIIMRLLGHENASTTASFYAFATLDMMRQAITAATPMLNDSDQPLTDQTLQVLYSLR